MLDHFHSFSFAFGLGGPNFALVARSSPWWLEILPWRPVASIDALFFRDGCSISSSSNSCSNRDRCYVPDFVTIFTVIRYDTKWYGTIRYDTKWYDTIHYNLISRISRWRTRRFMNAYELLICSIMNNEWWMMNTRILGYLEILLIGDGTRWYE